MKIPIDSVVNQVKTSPYSVNDILLFASKAERKRLGDNFDSYVAKLPKPGKKAGGGAKPKQEEIKMSADDGAKKG